MHNFFLNTCKQTYILVYTETSLVIIVYKNKDISTWYRTFCKSVVNKNCFWPSFDLFQTISEHEFFMPYLVEQKKFPKNHFWVLFYRAKSIWYNFRTSKNFGFFSQNFSFFWIFLKCFDPPYCQNEKKWSQQKMTYECTFIAQNSFQTFWGLQKVWILFFKKL